MARKLISIDLDFLEKNVAPLFEVKQLDDITLSINMYMDGVEYDATGQTGLLSVKSTKGTYTQETDIVLDISKATIKVNNGMIQDQGVCYGELTLTDANGTMSSTDFVFLVSNRISEGGLDSGQIQSYYEQFKKLLADSTNKMDKALDDMATEKDAMFEEFSTGLTNLINNTQSQIDAQVTRIDTAIGAGTVDLETKDARTDMDGVAHANLRARLESDLKKGKEIYENVEGSYITVNDTVQGAVTDIEVIGDTYQDPNNLSNIISAGIVQSDGQVKMSISSCGKNILDPTRCELGTIDPNTGNNMSSTIKRRTDFIKIRPSKVRISGTLEVDNYFYYYDKNKKFIESQVWGGSGLDNNTPANCSYIRLIFGTNEDANKIQLEYGTVETQYEPYTESRCDILLPCQLEGLESGRDRLYYDKELGKWCVDKNIHDKYMESNDFFSIEPPILENCMKFVSSANYINSEPNSNIISNKFVKGDDTIVNSIRIAIDGKMVVNIETSRLPSQDVKGLQDYIKTEIPFIKYISKTPEKIILPLDTQISLNSFFGTTNAWIESGEVDGIIKGKVSKSLASSINSAHAEIDKLDDRVKNIEGLQESQNFKYATSKGHIVCEQTKNGVIDKLKLSGRTLNNLSSVKSMTFSKTEANKYIYVDRFVPLAKRNTIYTIIVNVVNNPNTLTNKTVFAFINGTAMGSITDYRITSTTGLQIFTLKTKDEEFPNGVAFRFANADGGSIGSYTCDDIVILEGDYTQNPPSYFEGLASVGDGADKLEVLSANSKYKHEIRFGENRLDYRLTTTLQSGEKVYNCADKPLTLLCINSSGAWVEDVKLLPKTYLEIREGLNIKTISLYASNGWDVSKVTKTLDELIQVEGMKSHKKQILYYDPSDQTWKKPTLRGTDTIQDTIEQLDNGKSKYTRRFKTIQLLSTMNWGNGVSNSESKLTQSFNVVVPGAKKNGEILGNRFNKNSVYSDDVGINCEATNDIYVRVLKSDLATVDIDGWKVKLKAWEDAGTPLEIVYEVAEEVYECTPLNLNSYADETMIQFVGGPIAPGMEFEITSYVNNLILNNRDRLSNLEKFIYEQNLAMFTIGLNVLNNNLQGGN